MITALDCAEKLPLLCPAAMKKLEGTGKAELLVDRLIEAPPAGAGPLNVIVTVADCPAATVLGLIERPVSVGRPAVATVTVTLAVRLLLLYVAVTMVVVVEVIAVADDSEKLAVLWPAGIVKAHGTGKAVLFAERPTTAPPEGASPVKLIVTVAMDPAVTLAGAILSDCSVGRIGGAWQMFDGTRTVAILESVVPAVFFARTKYE